MTDELASELQGFEDYAHHDGGLHWSALEFMTMLGYTDWRAFRQGVVQKACDACTTLRIPVAENFRPTRTRVAGRAVADLRLTRFACYLIAMNGDPRMPEVAQAQRYFAGLAEALQETAESAEEVDRLLIRGEIADQERSLSSTASRQQLQNYALFQDAGYLGMYNMHLFQVRLRKRVPPSRSPLDFMHREELAANLFRLTQTEAKIRNQNIKGQAGLEAAAHEVGSTVRRTMEQMSGTKPEQLPPAEDLKQVAQELRATSRSFKRMDRLPPGQHGPDP